ncbi:MAG: hypothetical protein ACI9KN_001186 [Gammaproteobacteria bacterium]|jgi:hypothetical protein
MHIRLLLVFSFIFYCVRIRTNPANYFQLNAPFFNKSKGIFSKLDIDRLIPQRWQLRQNADNGLVTDFQFPVFVKPEWGQNAYGIRRADSLAELDDIRRQSADSKMPRIIQEAANEAREFEVFFILSAADESRAAVLTVSEALNVVKKKLPINSINNANTFYQELTDSLSVEQLDAIWQHMRSFGRFGISRVGLRADSIDAMVKGDFHVIEINLFVPMPINLLDPSKTLRQKVTTVLNTTWHLAQIVKHIPAEQEHQSVFFKKWLVARKVKMLPQTL